jgi:hypothetical protein
VRESSEFRSSTLAFSRSARRWAADCSKGVGSSSASGCPFRTCELKSTKSFAMIPETWLPTLTVVTAESVPVAVTVATTSPRSSFALRYLGAAPVSRRK